MKCYRYIQGYDNDFTFLTIKVPLSLSFSSMFISAFVPTRKDNVFTVITSFIAGRKDNLCLQEKI